MTADCWTSSLEPQFAVDFALGNHYVSTFPESPFVDRLMMRALTRDGRVSGDESRRHSAAGGDAGGASSPSAPRSGPC